MAQHQDACAPLFPCGLIAKDSLAEVRAIAGRLPAVSGMGLELHLGADLPRTDFLLRLTQRELRSSPALLAAPLFAQPRWSPFSRLLAAWADPAARALDPIDNVWLEFDIGTSYTPESAPSLFFDVDRGDRLSAAQKLAVMSAVFETLAVATPPAIQKQLRYCVEQAGPELRLYYIGLMLSRSAEAVRVCLLGQRAAALRPYLERVECGGDLECIEKILVRYAAGADKIILDIDVAARTHDAIGVEIFAVPSCPWEELLSRLVHDGLCKAEERTAILGFAGTSVPADRGARRLIRCINHIKLSVGPGGALRAKAYLYLCHA